MDAGMMRTCIAFTSESVRHENSNVPNDFHIEYKLKQEYAARWFLFIRINN